MYNDLWIDPDDELWLYPGPESEDVQEPVSRLLDEVIVLWMLRAQIKRALEGGSDESSSRRR